MSILLTLCAYLYNPSDWQHFPKLGDIRNFTADAFNTVYAVAANAIVELDDQTDMPSRVFTQAEGLPAKISFALYDIYTQDIWVVANTGELYEFNPSAGMTSKVFLESTSPVTSLGLNRGYVFLKHANQVQAVDKLARQKADVSPDSTTTWTLSLDRNAMRRDYPFLYPWLLDDEDFVSRAYTNIFVHSNSAYVAVQGYGYLVFDAMAWRETLRYRSPQATGVYSFVALDTSLYAFGSNGVDQLSRGNVLFRSYAKWGTTPVPQPAWSVGISNNLRLVSYDRVRFADGNLFLIDGDEVDVFNLGQKNLSKIQGAKSIYDVDFHDDSLYVANSDGVFLTIVPKGTPRALEDERGRLVRTDVLAIVRGAHARYFWTGKMLVKQSRAGWVYYVAPGFMPVPQRSVTGSDSFIIFGGTGGVSIYNPETYNQIFLTKQDGLLSDEVTAVYLDGHQLWIATDAGYSRFDLSSVLP